MQKKNCVGGSSFFLFLLSLFLLLSFLVVVCFFKTAKAFANHTASPPGLQLWGQRSQAGFRSVHQMIKTVDLTDLNGHGSESWLAVVTLVAALISACCWRSFSCSFLSSITTCSISLNWAQTDDIIYMTACPVHHHQLFSVPRSALGVSHLPPHIQQSVHVHCSLAAHVVDLLLGLLQHLLRALPPLLQLLLQLLINTIRFSYRV